MKTLLLFTTLALTSCGGTFTLSPTGSVSYTTPQYLKPVIVPEK